MPGHTGPGRRRSPFFAACPAGLARILRSQLAEIPGVEVTGHGSGGQSDYVLFEADREGRGEALSMRLTSDVFAEAGRVSRAGRTDPALLAARCWRPDSVQRALSVWAEQVRPLSAGLTFRVSTRVQTGPRPFRADLRSALTSVIQRSRPRWRPASQAQLEIWLSEWRDGELIVGLRLGGNRAGQHDGDQETAQPELPSAIAAAMVLLAGEPRGVLLDPRCGGGTILAEALAAGWAAEGTDPNPAALAAASRAAAGARIREGDAGEILEPDDSVAACVSRLRAAPPGRGESVADEWLGAALAEMSRVTRSDGAVVVLAPEIPRAAIPAALRLRQQVPVWLPGGWETIWVFRRA